MKKQIPLLLSSSFYIFFSSFLTFSLSPFLYWKPSFSLRRVKNPFELSPKNMDKTLTVNQKRANKQPKTKKKQPLKVVYITNPIKLKASVSEFRALVQEFTGQDADFSESSRFAVADAVDGSQGEVAIASKVAAEGNVDAVLEEVGKIGHTGDVDVVQKESDLSTFGSYDDDDDAFYSPQMMENFPGTAASNLWHGDAYLDVFKSLDAM